MQIRSVGIDLGKTTFHLVALGASDKVLVKKKFTQKQLLTQDPDPWRTCCRDADKTRSILDRRMDERA
jgi:hypothetical protein